MIILAHDGSVYGDWVARYAVRLAGAEKNRKLLVLHVLEGKIGREIVEARLGALAEQCSADGIECLLRPLEPDVSAYRTLRHALPHEPDTLLVCGTRAKPRKTRWLTGSVAEQLLRLQQLPVLALRVVQPGLLGYPRDLLLPLAGHQGGFDRIRPIFDRLVPQLRSVHLFRTAPVSQFRRPHLSSGVESSLRRGCIGYLEKFRAEMALHCEPRPFSVELRTSVCSDWPNEVLVQASRLKVQLMLLGVSERSLAHRVFHGPGLERVLTETPCDVGIYRGP